MKNKGFPDHIVKTVQSLYINTKIKTDKGTSVSNKEIHINRGAKQGCPMSPTLFNTVEPHKSGTRKFGIIKNPALF
jgi:hypothetical protein